MYVFQHGSALQIRKTLRLSKRSHDMDHHRRVKSSRAKTHDARAPLERSRLPHTRSRLGPRRTRAEPARPPRLPFSDAPRPSAAAEHSTRPPALFALSGRTSGVFRQAGRQAGPSLGGRPPARQPARQPASHAFQPASGADRQREDMQAYAVCLFCPQIHCALAGGGGGAQCTRTKSRVVCCGWWGKKRRGAGRGGGEGARAGGTTMASQPERSRGCASIAIALCSLASHPHRTRHDQQGKESAAQTCAST